MTDFLAARKKSSANIGIVNSGALLHQSAAFDSSLNMLTENQLKMDIKQ